MVKWAELHLALETYIPQVTSILGDERDFLSLHMKSRDDATTLAVLKRYGSDGAPVVCFGSGYGVAGALMGLEGSVAGGNWRPDKPWSPLKK
jgi:hypothetical protein